MDDALGQQAVEALRRGDGKAALDLLTRCSVTDPEPRKPWLALAQAHRLIGDTQAEMKALQTLFVHEPRNLAGLLLAGDCSQTSGDDRAASAFYQAALNQASVTTGITPSLGQMLAKAEAFFCKRWRPV